MGFLKRFFSRGEKIDKEDLSLSPPTESEFAVINDFLKGSAELNLHTPLNSRSTEYFKTADEILRDVPVTDESAEVLALQSFITHGEELVEKDEEIVLILEQEKDLIEEEKEKL